MTSSLVAVGRRLVERLRSAGFEAYFVGGCVRDMIMGKPPADIDIATSATPPQVRRLFRRTVAVGAQFGVVIVLEEGFRFEVATFRADAEYLDGRRPSRVRFADARADVLRRDFTINGMLYDPLADRVIDYVGGRADIEARVVRCIGDPAARLAEDRLRILRAVRFACRLDFRLDPDTFAAAKAAAPGLTAVSVERIRDELTRILTEGGAARGVRLLRDIDALRVVLPEVQDLVAAPPPADSRAEGDAFDHALRALDALREPGADLAWAALLLLACERAAAQEGAPSPGEPARRICRRLRMSNAAVEKVSWLVSARPRVARAPRLGEADLKRLLREPHIADLLELHRAYCIAGRSALDGWEFCRRKLREIPPDALRPAPLLDGRRLIALGYQPGPRFKDILAAVEQAQLEGRLDTSEAAEAFVLREFPPERA